MLFWWVLLSGITGLVCGGYVQRVDPPGTPCVSEPVSEAEPASAHSAGSVVSSTSGTPLTDEIMELVDGYLDAFRGYMTGHASLPEVVPFTIALRSRLVSLEQELTKSRLDALTAEAQRQGMYESEKGTPRIEGGGGCPGVVNARRPSASEAFGRGNIGVSATQPSDLDAATPFPSDADECPCVGCRNDPSKSSTPRTTEPL